MSQPILEVQNLSKTFTGAGILRRDPAKALKDVSFSIEEGDIFGLVGESGSGKTTLARTILYLEAPSSGEVFFRGIRLSKLSTGKLRKLRPRIQIIFQDPHSALDPRLTIGQSMEEGMKNLGFPPKKRRAEVKALLDLVGIPWSQEDWYPHEFSGGQKQRIVIARALSMKPEFLILDEPVSNLDVSIQAGIINLLLDLKREYNLSYMFISHDLDLIGYLSTTIGVLKDGRLVESGPAEQILSNPTHPYTREMVENPLSFMDRADTKRREECSWIEHENLPPPSPREP
ncbi:MAG: ATP-binding cassette domain-containing protein [Spirochaetales bacterium]|jgi:ABC-type oligopeptide transport system ATPase subunit|nr:ATP-binding cassette domain-containing protein [Spirochaetales bacterium]